MIVEHKRLTKANPSFGSRQGEEWWKQVELSVAPFHGFALGGVYPLRDKGTGELTLVYEVPTVLPLFFRDASVFTSDLGPSGDFW